MKQDIDVTLTRRQTQVMRFYLKGCTAKEIAQKLTLSPRTVEFYIASIKDLFDVRSRATCMEKAIGLGYVDLVFYQ